MAIFQKELNSIKVLLKVGLELESVLSVKLEEHIFFILAHCVWVVALSRGPVGWPVWHLITGCHLCVCPTVRSGNVGACPNITLAIE